MRKKKSAYANDISQECLLMGAKFLADPPTIIINESIKSGSVYITGYIYSANGSRYVFILEHMGTWT